MQTIDNPAPAAPSFRDRAGGIIAFGIVLTMLYFGRDVLIPLTLALMLSLLIAPLVRVLRRIGLGQTLSVFAAVLALAVSVAAIAVVLGTQVLRMGASLPQYQETIQQKLQNLDELTLGRLNTLTSEANRLIVRHGVTSPTPPTFLVLPQATLASQSTDTQPAAPVPVELREPRADPFQILGKILGAIWIPTQTTGIVLVVLVFVLLEHEALRDRFIRLAGGTNIRATTLALNDAGERLSRFFVSQFAVNMAVGATIGLGLALLGLPHAMLWGALAAALRFVPYVGVWIAAIFATALAVAVVPGWALAVATLGLFIVVEVVAAQLVEPQLYGHATGLSPLSVVVAAIFWSALWGPMGLILSTPLTLCLVVGGRHIKALHFLDLLLGDTQALTLPQKFYQRALSGDSQEIVTNARIYLKSNTLAEYCDRVLIPAMHLSRLDFELGAIGQEQQARIRAVLVEVVSSLGGNDPSRSLRRRPGSVLDPQTSGRTLRSQRERQAGKWQGPIEVPRGSVMVCLALGAVADELATELLVRILRNEKQDARHFSVGDADVAIPPETTPGAVAIVYLVSAYPSEERDKSDAVAGRVRQLLPGALLVNVFLPGLSVIPDAPAHQGTSDHVVTSFVEAVRICMEREQQLAPQPATESV